MMIGARWAEVASAAGVSHAGGHVLAAAGDINTTGVLSFLASKVAPILLAILGIIFLSRASKGEVSRVLTSSAIAIVGLVFIAGAATLFFLGDYLMGILFK